MNEKKQIQAQSVLNVKQSYNSSQRKKISKNQSNNIQKNIDDQAKVNCGSDIKLKLKFSENQPKREILAIDYETYDYEKVKMSNQKQKQVNIPKYKKAKKCQQILDQKIGNQLRSQSFATVAVSSLIQNDMMNQQNQQHLDSYQIEMNECTAFIQNDKNQQFQNQDFNDLKYSQKLEERIIRLEQFQFSCEQELLELNMTINRYANNYSITQQFIEQTNQDKIMINQNLQSMIQQIIDVKMSSHFQNNQKNPQNSIIVSTTIDKQIESILNNQQENLINGVNDQRIKQIEELIKNVKNEMQIQEKKLQKQILGTLQYTKQRIEQLSNQMNANLISQNQNDEIESSNQCINIVSQPHQKLPNLQQSKIIKKQNSEKHKNNKRQSSNPKPDIKIDKSKCQNILINSATSRRSSIKNQNQKLRYQNSQKQSVSNIQKVKQKIDQQNIKRGRQSQKSDRSINNFQVIQTLSSSESNGKIKKKRCRSSLMNRQQKSSQEFSESSIVNRDENDSLLENEVQNAVLETAKDKLRMATIERKKLSSINAESRIRNSQVQNNYHTNRKNNISVSQCFSNNQLNVNDRKNGELLQHQNIQNNINNFGSQTKHVIKLNQIKVKKPVLDEESELREFIQQEEMEQQQRQRFFQNNYNQSSSHLFTKVKVTDAHKNQTFNSNSNNFFYE